MRICFIANLYPPLARGGAGRVVSEEVHALKREGHEVSVITAEDVREDGSVEPRMTVEDGVRVYRFFPLNLYFYGELGRHGMLSRMAWNFWDLINPHAASVVRRILEDEKPDVVHTHNLKGIGFSIPGVLRRLGIRHVHTLHDVQLVEPSGQLMLGSEERVDDAKHRFYMRVMRWRMGSPDVVISPSNYLMRFHMDRGFFPASEPVLLANPSPADAVPSHSKSKETRFLFLGQLEPHKGILWLMEVVKKFFVKRPMARLDIVGDGASKDDALAMAASERRFAFFGRLRPEQFPKIFRDTDYVVVPSLCHENAPTVIGEAFAYGVPVIVADIGGAAESVRDGHNGYVFRPGDMKSLLETLERAASNRKWSLMSDAARRTAELRDAVSHAKHLYGVYADRDVTLPYHGPVVPVRYETHETVPEHVMKSIERYARRTREEGEAKTKKAPKRAAKRKAKTPA